MKIANPTRLTREGLEGAPKDPWMDSLLQHINTSNEEKTQALQQNLTIADNMNAAITDPMRMVHGVERKIKNPLKSRPVGIKAARSMSINGGTRYRVHDLDWRFVDGTDTTTPQQIGITVRYSPGTIAETIESTLAYTSGATLTTATPANVVSISLTPGIWLVSAFPGFYGNGGSPTGTALYANVTTTSATLNGIPGDTLGESPTMPTGVASVYTPIMPKRITVTSTTTYYLVAQTAHTVGTIKGFGRLSAVRLDVDPSAKNDVTFIVYGG